MRTQRRPARGSTEPAVEAWASGRERYLDHLKVLLVAAIVALHGVPSCATA